MVEALIEVKGNRRVVMQGVKHADRNNPQGFLEAQIRLPDKLGRQFYEAEVVKDPVKRLKGVR